MGVLGKFVGIDTAGDANENVECFISVEIVFVVCISFGDVVGFG